jgi:methylthioribose-1-phosphate isomerase
LGRNKINEGSCFLGISNISKVRGAPAIAIVGILSICVDIQKQSFSDMQSLVKWVEQSCEHLSTSRPTAVNLFEALGRLKSLVNVLVLKDGVQASYVVGEVIKFGKELFRKDVEDNMNIGKFGSEWIIKQCGSEKNIRVLTHCNTGSLATAGYGTALGIVRALNSRGSLEQVFCTETRPYNQGSRLTAYELVVENMPHATLICDSMAAYLMSTLKSKNQGLTAVIVGADRVARNGDTANKIGTYALALAAKHHGVLFIVAAPTTSIDLNIDDGSKIPVEERKPEELTQVQGVSVEGDNEKLIKVSIAPKAIGIWNPSFDVTPASLIDAIVTEKGVHVKTEGSNSFDLG